MAVASDLQRSLSQTVLLVVAGLAGIAAPVQAGPVATCGSDVLFVMDSSGSMGVGNGSRLDLAQQTALGITSGLEHHDWSGVIEYDHVVQVTSSLSGSHAGTETAIRSLVSDGGTLAGAALRAAEAEFGVRGQADRRPVVVHVTDGHAADGDEVAAAAQRLRDNGTDVFVVLLFRDDTQARQQASEPLGRHVLYVGSDEDASRAARMVASALEAHGPCRPTWSVCPDGLIAPAGRLLQAHYEAVPANGSAAIQAELPATASFTATAGDPATGTLSWRPTGDQAGEVFFLAFEAVDDGARGTSSCTTTVHVVSGCDGGDCEDGDADGVWTNNDNCPDVPNFGQHDIDGDRLGDACDRDHDNDGVVNDGDNCVWAANEGQQDLDGDGAGDACDDGDADGLSDALDNCPAVPNPEQGDVDLDHVGDACDDSDGDGVLDEDDNCVVHANPGQEDGNGDGVGDHCQDRDADGTRDHADNCPDAPNRDQADRDGDGAGDACDLVLDEAPCDVYLTSDRQWTSVGGVTVSHAWYRAEAGCVSSA